MKQQKKVLFILQGRTGGAERVSVNISKELQKNDFKVEYVIVSDKVEDIKNLITSDPIWHHVRISNIWDFTTIKLLRLFRKARPDYVFSSVMYLNPRVIIASKLYNKDCKIIIRNCNTIKDLRFDLMYLLRKTYIYADTIIAQQEEMAEEILSQIPGTNGKVVSLFNPIDTDLIDEYCSAPNPYEDKNTIKIVWPARVSFVKGQDLLIKALHKLHNEGRLYHLYFLGRYDTGDKYYQLLMGLINEYHLEQYIHFVGHQPNPYTWIKNSNCFVLPSRNEGLPNALIEAMYIGVPVVATKCIPVISRIVCAGENGYLAEPENENSLAESIKKALSLKKVVSKNFNSDNNKFISIFNDDK